LNPTTLTQAKDDFDKARNKAFLSKIQNFLHPDRDKLLSFNDVKNIIKPRNEVYMGLKQVPIELIVGSEGRYQDFNKYFLPKRDFLRSRWESVDGAVIESVTLPPIKLYEIGGVYFVRDGNHRVSVAKAQGVEMIDAEVTSLSSDVAIKPGMGVPELRKEVIRLERDAFERRTSFAELTGCTTLNFSATGRYDVIYNHILVHKYYINEGITGEIPFAIAMFSWYHTVYMPIIKIIRQSGTVKHFPGRTESDLYVFIVKRWDELKKQYGDSTPPEAALRDLLTNKKQLSDYELSAGVGA
jgi:hypothetical protein